MNKKWIAISLTSLIWIFAIFGAVECGFFIFNLSAWRPPEMDAFRITTKKSPMPVVTLTNEGLLVLNIPETLKAWKLQTKEAKKKSIPEPALK